MTVGETVVSQFPVELEILEEIVKRREKAVMVKKVLLETNNKNLR